MDNLYYRPSVRTSRKSFKGNKARYLKLFYPFLVILFLIVLIWGVVKIWNYFANLNSTSFSDSATVYIAEGISAQKQSFGNSQFLPVLSGDVAFEGDGVRTLQDTRAVLEFFNGLKVRLDESTSVVIEKIENKRNEETIQLKVLTGNVWLNKSESVKSASNLVVSTNYMQIKTMGTTFAVKAGLPESVSVLDGTVLVDIVDVNAVSEEGLAVIDQVNISAGQQMLLDNEAYQSFVRRETPRVLDDISAEFSDSDWYEWNVAEDENPTSFAADSTLRSNNNYISQIDETVGLDEDSELDVLEEDELDGPKPEFTFPKNDEVVTTERIEILGTVPVGTQAVEITSFENGTPEPYVLKAFKPGDTTFKYIAVYEAGNTGNLRLGSNRFEAIAIDENGEESVAAKLEFTLEINGQSGEDSSDSSEDADSGTTSNSSSSDVDVSNLEFSADLAAPVLKTVNGEAAQSGYSLKEPRGLVVGQIGTWAKSVVVNGYKLQQFEPYSGEFTYILSAGFNTLKEGENKIVVYGFDDSGKRGMPATFVINWQP